MRSLTLASATAALLLSVAATTTHGQSGSSDSSALLDSSQGEQFTERVFVTTTTAAPTTPAPTLDPTLACPQATFTGGAARTGAYHVVHGENFAVSVGPSGSCGGTASYSLSLIPQGFSPGVLAQGYEFNYTQFGYSAVGYDWQHRSLITGLVSGNANLHQYTPATGATSSATFTASCPGDDVTFVIQSTSSNGYSYSIGTVECFHVPKTMRNNWNGNYKPTNLAVWVHSTEKATIKGMLLAAHQNFPATGGAAYVGGFKLQTATVTTVATFQALQDQVNTLVNNPSQVISCSDLEFDASTVSSLTDALIIVAGGVARTTCTSTLNTQVPTALATISASADVMIVLNSAAEHTANAQIATQISGAYFVGYPTTGNRAVYRALHRYTVSRWERTASTCTAPVKTLPSDATTVVMRNSMLDERVLRWNGLCGVTACCVGSRCSSNVAADGRSCVLPLPTGWNTEYQITIKHSAGEHTIAAVIETTWNRIFYVSNRYWSYPNGYTKLQDTAAGTKFAVQRRSETEVCAQLVCLPDAKALTNAQLTVASDTWCSTSASWALPPWYRARSSSTSKSEYSYNYVYYYFTVYGWSRSLSPWSNGVDKTHAEATVVRTSTTGCDCKAIGVRTWESFSVKVPANTRMLDGSASGTETDTNSIQYAESKQIVLSNRWGLSLPPVPSDASESTKRSWCKCWASADRKDDVVRLRVNEAGKCFQCPATISETGIVPRGFWRIWSWGSDWYNNAFNEQGTTSQRCFRAAGAWQTAARTPWERRCCYEPHPNGVAGLWKYLRFYPSKLVVSNGWGSWTDYQTERLFAQISDENPEQVCCNDIRTGSASLNNLLSCLFYKERRPTIFATNSPFELRRGCSETWTPAPVRGWGRGDPYCSTIDGAGFECNFWGEALWTSCGSWKVHTAAEPVSTGATATILTAVAVSEGNETVVVQRQDGDSVVRVNGEEIDEDFTGAFLEVSFDTNENNLTIARINSIAGGHEVEIITETSSLTLSVAPVNCTGQCAGLLGNCDGDASNDVKSRDGSVQLSLTASGSDIFYNVVQSFLINDTAQSLMDYEVSKPESTSTSYTPTFVDATVLANCPASCNQDPGCCLDNQVAGSTFAAETSSTITAISAVANTSLPVSSISGGYNWPPTINMNAEVEILNGLTLTQDIIVTDTNGIQSLTIDACSASDVTCTQDLTVTATTSQKWTLSMTATRNFTVTVTATDSLGAVTNGYMIISAVPPAPQPANSVSFTVLVEGSGFNSGHVFSIFSTALALDLANIINAYFDANPNSAVEFTTSNDFTPATFTDATNGVSVAMYISGSTQEEADARLAALNAQSVLELVETNAALAFTREEVVTPTYAPEDATTTTTTTPVTTADPNATDVTPAPTTGAAHIATILSTFVAVVLSCFVFA